MAAKTMKRFYADVVRGDMQAVRNFFSEELKRAHKARDKANDDIAEIETLLASTDRGIEFIEAAENGQLQLEFSDAVQTTTAPRDEAVATGQSVMVGEPGACAHTWEAKTETVDGVDRNYWRCGQEGCEATLYYDPQHSCDFDGGRCVICDRPEAAPVTESAETADAAPSEEAASDSAEPAADSASEEEPKKKRGRRNQTNLQLVS
jgi:hypothetical protein